jgi:hypothetical protein
MKRVMILAVLSAASASFAVGQDVNGDWQGTLNTGAGELHLVLHISKTSGALHATLDSPDQGANGIPVSSISFKDLQLKLGVDAVHGSYDGKLSSDGQTISGTWTQGQGLPLDFKRSAAPVKTSKPAPAAKPSDIDGAWMGSLDTGALKLRVIFHIVNTADGLTATMDSPDQGMKGHATTSVTRTGATLRIEAKGIGGAFEGKIAADRSSIGGTWTQGGASLPLVLKPLKNQAELAPTRLQNPVKPYPYHDEDVSDDNKVQNVTMAATLAQVQFVKQIDIYKAPGFLCDPLCPLWLKPLNSPNTARNTRIEG